MGTLRQIVRGEANLNIIARRKTWALVSAIVLGLSLVGIFGRQLNLGLEFKGGTSFTVRLERDVGVADLEAALEGFELGDAKVQIQRPRGAGASEALIRTKHFADRDALARAQNAIARAAGQSSPDAVSINDVGPTWGRQVSTKALRGLIVFLILVSLYIAFRFEVKMAVGALAALFHDLLATAGVYAMVGFEVTPATVIALLTLMGFSLYDTVVVFDRVRENAATLSATSKTTYSEMVNRSVNEVLIRSINTSLTSVLPVAGLLFVGVLLFGAVTLKDLALAMFVGTLVSTYSSIFVASPILAALKEREPRYRALRARAAASDARRGASRAPTVTRPATPVEEAVPVGGDGDKPIRGSGQPLRVHRPPPRPRRRKRGKGRRR